MRAKRQGPPGASATGRRELLRTMTAGMGLGAMALSARPIGAVVRRLLGPGEARAQGCVLTPELTEGPYYLEDAPLRRNVLERRAGTPLWLSLRIRDAGSCAAIPGAVVEIWHADAGGEYSGFNGADNDTFMRGRLRAGGAGVVTFRTVYPGWYRGRTPHIHFKVRVGGVEAHTGQLFFPEGVTDAVYAREPYATRGDRDTTNATDGIFAGGGAQSILTLAARGSGYWGAITLSVAT